MATPTGDDANREQRERSGDALVKLLLDRLEERRAVPDPVPAPAPKPNTVAVVAISVATAVLGAMLVGVLSGGFTTWSQAQAVPGQIMGLTRQIEALTVDMRSALAKLQSDNGTASDRLSQAINELRLANQSTNLAVTAAGQRLEQTERGTRDFGERLTGLERQNAGQQTQLERLSVQLDGAVKAGQARDDATDKAVEAAAAALNLRLRDVEVRNKEVQDRIIASIAGLREQLAELMRQPRGQRQTLEMEKAPEESPKVLTLEARR